MMVVTVEVWPGGRVLNRRVIGIMNVGNLSALAEVSDYAYTIDGSEEKTLKGHRRSDGAWELVRKILEQEGDA